MKTRNSQLTLISHIAQSVKNVCFDLVGNAFFFWVEFLRPDFFLFIYFSFFVFLIIPGLRD